MRLHLTSLRAKLIPGKSQFEEHNLAKKHSALSRLSRFLGRRVKKTREADDECTERTAPSIPDAVLATHLLQPVTASVVDVITDQHSYGNSLLEETLADGRNKESSSEPEIQCDESVAGGRGSGCVTEPRCDEECYWNTMIGEICGPISYSIEYTPKSLVTASNVSETPLAKQTGNASLIQAPRGIQDIQENTASPESHFGSVSSASTLFNSSIAPSLEESPARPRLRKYASVGECCLSLQKPSYPPFNERSNGHLSFPLHTKKRTQEAPSTDPSISNGSPEVNLDNSEIHDKALRRKVEAGVLRETELTNAIKDARSRENLLIGRFEQQTQQLNWTNAALEAARSGEVALIKQLKDQTEHRSMILGQLEVARQDINHIQLAAEKAQGREETLAETLKQETSRAHALATEVESLKGDLESARHDANHFRAENKGLARFVMSLQDESVLPDEVSGKAMPTESCTACAHLLGHLTQVKRVNLSMAKKLKDYRLTVENNVEQMKRYRAWAEGTPQEKEIEAHELVKGLEKEVADMKSANFDLCSQVTEEMERSSDAKTRAELEVDRLTKLCDFKAIQIASMEADIGRVDSLQLHNAELLDMMSKPEEPAMFEVQRQNFAEEISALTARANIFEMQAQVALEEVAARRSKLHKISTKLSKLKESLEKARVEKAQVDLEIENIRFYEDMKENETNEVEAAHQLALRKLEATIENLQHERERFLRDIPDYLMARDKYLYDIKCWEIDDLRGNVQQMSAQIDQLQERNETYAYYAHAYEMLEAELNIADSWVGIRDMGRTAFERALRGVLEDEYGHVGHLYQQAGERLKKEGERETLARNSSQERN